MSETIHIGNQTSFSAATPTEPFDYALANGFDAFEWFPDKRPSGEGWDESALSQELRAHIRKQARCRGMRLSVHAHWTINPLNPEAVRLLQKEIELARDLEASVLVIHLYTELGLAAYAKAMLGPLSLAASVGVQIAIENTPRTPPADFNALFATLAELNPRELRDVGMCFDLGHANLCASTLNNYLGYLDQLEPHVPIIHAHVHENWGDADTHLPLFSGPAAAEDSGVRGFIRRLKQRQFSGSLILEQWPNPPALLNQARDRLMRLWNDSDHEYGISRPRLEPAPAERKPGGLATRP